MHEVRVNANFWSINQVLKFNFVLFLNASLAFGKLRTLLIQFFNKCLFLHADRCCCFLPAIDKHFIAVAINIKLKGFIYIPFFQFQQRFILHFCFSICKQYLWPLLILYNLLSILNYLLCTSISFLTSCIMIYVLELFLETPAHVLSYVSPLLRLYSDVWLGFNFIY